VGTDASLGVWVVWIGLTPALSSGRTRRSAGSCQRLDKADPSASTVCHTPRAAFARTTTHNSHSGRSRQTLLLSLTTQWLPTLLSKNARPSPDRDRVSIVTYTYASD
jgi:hypothetical protein